MLSSLWVTEALGKTEVDDIDVVLLLSNTDQEVIRLDISVKEMPRVNEFNTLKLNKVKLVGSKHRIRLKYKVRKANLGISKG